MASAFMKWTKERLFGSLLGRVHERLLGYFVDLPGSLSFRGIFDRLELNNVCLDTVKISAELYAAGIPIKICYGHIGTMKLNLYLTQARSHVLLEDVIIILSPQTGSQELLSTVECNLNIVKRHIAEVMSRVTRQFLGNSVDEDVAQAEDLSALSWKEVATWLFRYDPNLTISINNIHVRYESDHTLTPFYSVGLVWETLSIRPAEIFWVLEWPRVDVPGSKLAVNHCSPHSVSRSIYATPVNESRKSLKDPLVPAAETGDVYVGSDEKGFVYNSMHDKNADNTRLRRGSSFPASTETGTSLAGGKSIFIGTCQGLGIYCNTAGRPWIRPELIKCQPLGLTNEMGPREKLYERLPALKLQLRAKKEFLNNQWMLHPLGFDFQFGLQGPEVAEKDSGAGDAKWTGARVLFSVQETLHITLNPSIIRTMSALFSSCKHFYIRKEMNVFRSLTVLSELRDGKRICKTARQHWDICRQFVYVLRSHHQGFSLRTWRAVIIK